MMNPIELRKLKERAPLPIIITVILLAAPGYLLGPQYEKLAATETMFDQAVVNAKDSLNQRSEDARLRARQKVLKADLGRLERWMPPADYLPAIVEEVNTLAGILGVRISSVYYQSGDRGPTAGLPPRLRLSLQIQADYAAMRGFLQALEGLPFPLLPVEITAERGQAFLIELLLLMRP